MNDTTNEHEARARAAKAFRLARVLRGADDVPTEQWLTADAELRERVASVAKVRKPSDETWRMAVDLLGVMRREET